MNENDQKRIIGYTVGVYDMFHIGHLNILETAKKNCDYLIVGVNSDETTYRYKGKHPIIPEGERMKIVQAIKYVDKVVLADDIVRVDENGVFAAFEEHKFDLLFIGDDHDSEPRWQKVDEYLRLRGARVFYIPYTKHISSGKLSEVIARLPFEI